MTVDIERNRDADGGGAVPERVATKFPPRPLCLGIASGRRDMEGVGFIAMLIIGAPAGWIAEKFTRSDHGLLTNIVVGIAGAFIGGFLASMLGISVRGFWGTL